LRDSCQISSTSLFISSRVKASSAPNGSSINRTAGSLASARTMEARCCMPPDSSRGILSPKPPSPTRSRSVSIRSLRRGACPADLERQLDVLADRPPGQQIGLLEHHADARVRTGDPLLAKGDGARGELVQSGQRPQQRGLATAGRADDRDELALAHRQVDILEGVHLAARLRAVGLGGASDIERLAWCVA
jgi:hypothetical protein